MTSKLITLSALLAAATAQINIDACTAASCQLQQDQYNSQGFPVMMACSGSPSMCNFIACDVSSNTCPDSGICSSDYVDTFGSICLESCATTPGICPFYQTCNTATGACEITACSTSADCPDPDTYLCGGGACVAKCTTIDWCSSTEYCVTSVGYCDTKPCTMFADEVQAEFCMNVTGSTTDRYCNLDDSGDAYCGPQPCMLNENCLTGEVCDNSTYSTMGGAYCYPDCNDNGGDVYCQDMLSDMAAMCSSNGVCALVWCTDDTPCAGLGDEFICDTDNQRCAMGCFGNDTLCYDPDFDMYSDELVCSDTTNLCERTPCSTSDDCSVGMVCGMEGECIAPCTDDDFCSDRFGWMYEGGLACNTDSGLCTAACDPALGNDICTTISSIVKFELFCDTMYTMDCQPVPCTVDSDCSLTGAQCYFLPENTTLCTVPCTDDADCQGRFSALPGAGFGDDQFCGVSGVCFPVEQNCTSKNDCEENFYCNAGGNCEMIPCHGADADADALCVEAYDNPLAACSDRSEFMGGRVCLDNACAEDADCTGKYNACATFVTPSQCYTSCSEDADCTAAYGFEGIPCELLLANSMGDGAPPTNITVCDIFGIGNSTYDGTLIPTLAPTAEPTEATMTTDDDFDGGESGVARYGVFVALAFVAAAHAF